jgi:hypothetical protein
MGSLTHPAEEPGLLIPTQSGHAIGGVEKTGIDWESQTS